MCLARGKGEMIWALPIFGNRGSVGHVSVFWLQWCGRVVGMWLRPGSGGWRYASVNCESEITLF